MAIVVSPLKIAPSDTDDAVEWEADGIVCSRCTTGGMVKEGAQVVVCHGWLAVEINTCGTSLASSFFRCLFVRSGLSHALGIRFG